MSRGVRRTVQLADVSDSAPADGDGLAFNATTGQYEPTAPGAAAHPNLASHDALGLATDAELATHAADSTAVHGITDTSTLVDTTDARLTNARTPTGGAGGVLSGSFPNPGFAVDMAEQGELDAHTGDTADAHDASAISFAPAGGIAATDVQAAIEELDAEKQPLDLDLTAFAGLGVAADKLPYGTGSHTLGLADFTAAGRALVDDADAAAQRTTLGLGTAAVAATGDFDAAGAAAAAASASIAKAFLDAKGDLISASANDTPAIVTVGANDTILMADSAAAAGLKWVASATPSDQAFGDAAAVGTADTFTRGDHKHGIPANPVTAHEAAGDPHAGYRLESADHTHATTGLQAGTIAHSVTTGQTATDHHAAPVAGPDADVTVDTAGAAGTAGAFARSAHGHKLATSATAGAAIGTAAAGTSGHAPSRDDHVHPTGAGVPSTQAFSDAAATGTGPAAAMTDHKHAMPADPTMALDWKASARLATEAALAAYTRTVNVLLANANGALATIDSVAPAVGDRILLKNGAASADNGIYVVDALGAAGAKWQMTRATDADASAEVTNGLTVVIDEGTINAHTIYNLQTNDPITLNTTALTFARIAGGLVKAAAATVAMGPDSTWLVLAANSGDITGVGQTVVMTITGVGVGRYHFRCQLVYQTTVGTTGIDVSVNHTGTLTQFIAEHRFASTGAAASTAAASEAETGGTGAIYEAQGKRTKDTVIGAGTVSVDAANTDMLSTIEGFMVVSVAGDFQIKMAAEAAALVCRAMQGSFLELKKLS